jgi:Na+-transporting NADH:ubiquinone oxidoreductase subunit NqrA
MGVSKNGGGNCVAVGSPRSEVKINPPSSSPAETLKISPENLEIANSYLASQNIADVSRNLGLPTDTITEVLGKREVRAYIDMVFLDYGFNNRFKMRSVMDAVINKKLQEMDESETGSGKDIIEIMALSHKMSMDILDRQIKLEEAKAKSANIKNQVNVQVNNEGGGGTKYENLISELMKAG